MLRNRVRAENGRVFGASAIELYKIYEQSLAPNVIVTMLFVDW